MDMRDLNVEAMHLVEFDFEAGNSAALAFARLQFQQEGAAVVLNGAQFIEVRAVAGGNDIAVTHQRRGFECDGLIEYGEAGGWGG